MEQSREVPYQHTQIQLQNHFHPKPKMKKKFVERCGVALDELRPHKGAKNNLSIKRQAAKGQSSMSLLQPVLVRRVARDGRECAARGGDQPAQLLRDLLFSEGTRHCSSPRPCSCWSHPHFVPNRPQRCVA
jgi:hypothetical protein